MTGRPEDHQFYDELAVGWALHALEPEDDAAFAGHVHGCQRCADTIAATSETMAAMATDLSAAEPSEALGDRLRLAVAQTTQVPPTPVTVLEPSTRVVEVPQPGYAARARKLLPALVAATLAAVVGLGAWNIVLNSERQELASTVAEQSAVMDARLVPGRATLAPLGNGGRPVASVVPRRGSVEVISHGLAPNDAEHTSYVVWGMRNGEPVPLGTFDVQGPQLAVQTVGSGLTGLDAYDAYAVSLEPGQEAPSAPTDVVATGQVTS